MIKRTVYISSPSYLRTQHKQMIVEFGGEEKGRVPIEDMGILVIDEAQVTLSHQLIRALQDANCLIVSCDDKHMPQSYMLPFVGHTEQMQAQRAQLSASKPLNKNIWKQIVSHKIANQAAVLRLREQYAAARKLDKLSDQVYTADKTAIEGHAAAVYWRHFMPDFVRDRYGPPPNNYLNYGYAILRGLVARAIVGAGLLPMVGVQHRNKYNPFCFADDMMEPFRPFVDLLVLDLIDMPQGLEQFLSQNTRNQLLTLVSMDAMYNGKKSPLMVGMTTTMASLRKCYLGTRKKIIMPQILEP